jgi:hypothetical protein
MRGAPYTQKRYYEDRALIRENRRVTLSWPNTSTEPPCHLGRRSEAFYVYVSHKQKARTFKLSSHFLGDRLDNVILQLLQPIVKLALHLDQPVNQALHRSRLHWWSVVYFLAYILPFSAGRIDQYQKNTKLPLSYATLSSAACGA